MPRQTEPNANNVLGDLLRGTMPGCQVRSENTQPFPSHPGRHALPASAALLALLAVSKMDGVDWADAEAIGRLRIGDFACGTVALLSAVYEQIAALHERTGGDPAGLHPVMMEEVLYGCDVMPSAIRPGPSA